MRYVRARYEDYIRDETYRIYVATCLQFAPQGKYVSVAYKDLINAKEKDNRTGDEIAIDIISNAGLKFG